MYKILQDRHSLTLPSEIWVSVVLRNKILITLYDDLLGLFIPILRCRRRVTTAILYKVIHPAVTFADDAAPFIFGECRYVHHVASQ